MVNNIQKRVIKGVGWAGLGQVTIRFLGFLNIIVLSKFLEARDFGLIAIGIFAFNLVEIAGDLGLRSAMIQRQDKEEEAGQIIFWVTGVLGLVYFILGVFLAKYVARFYNEEILTPIIKILSLALFLGPLSDIQGVLLQKRLEIKKFNIVLISSYLAKVILSIYLAYRGLGIWALVWGMVLHPALYSFIMWIILPWRPRLSFNKVVFRELFDYGRPVTLFAILSFIILNSDKAFIGKVLGSSSLGYYSLAFSLSNFMALNISAVAEYVLFPAYALLQSDIIRLREGFQKSLRYIAFIIFPLSLGIFILAREITIAIYGTKWLPMVPALKILAFYGLFRALSWFGNNIFLAKGEVKLMRNLRCCQFLIMAIMIYPFTIKWGIPGTAMAVTFAMGINVFLCFKKIAKLLNSSINEMIKTIRAPIISTVGMVLSIYFLKQFFVNGSVLALSLFILGGASVYIVFIFLMDRNIKKESREIIRTLLRD